MADGLAWGPYRFPVFAPGQLTGSDNELSAAFLSTSAFRALQHQRFELVLGDQVLWRKGTRGFLYQEGGQAREFAIKGKLKDYWPSEATVTDEQVLVLVMEDAWSRESACIIGMASNYTDALRLRMMEAAAYTCQQVVHHEDRAGESLCIALSEKNIQFIDNAQPWESSSYRLELGQEALGIHWYNNPASVGLRAAPQRVLPEVLPDIWKAPLSITHEGRPLVLEQLCVGLTTKGGSTRVLASPEPGAIQQTWQRAVEGLQSGDQLHLIARAEGEKAFFASVGIGVDPDPGAVFQDGAFSEFYGKASRRKVDRLPNPRAWLRRSGTVVEWGPHNWILRLRDGRASEATRYLPATALTALSVADWSVTYQGDVTASDSLMLWAMEAEAQPMPLFSEQAQRLLSQWSQRTEAFELQVTFALKNGADRGRLKLKLNQARPIAAERPEPLRLQPSLDPFQFVYRAGAPTLIRMDTSVERHRWMYEQYRNDPDVQVVPIPGFRTIERLRHESGRIVPEPAIGRVDLLDSDYINTDTIPEWFEFQDTPFNLQWRGLSGTLGEQVQSLDVFRNSSASDILLEIGNLAYPILQFELVIIPETGRGARVKSRSVEAEVIQQQIAGIAPNTSLFLTDLVIQDTDGQPKRFPITFSFNLK